MKLLTIPEACERLRISRATLYSLVKKGELAFVKVGGKSLIQEDAIDRLIARSTAVQPRRPPDPKQRALKAYFEELLQRGLVTEESRQAFFAPRASHFTPIKAKGKPASEIIIEERGER